MRYDFEIDLNGTTELSKISNRLTIFPNPKCGMFTIIASNNKSYQIKIYNAVRAEVFQSEINPGLSGKVEIDLSNQPKGVYFICAVSEKESLPQQIILQ